jgi:MATE family multidrug resistance protein
MLCCSVALIFLRSTISELFSDNVVVIGISSSLLLIAAFFQLFDGLQVIALGALRGMNDNKIPTALALIAYWGIALPACYFFAFTEGMGANGVWCGLSAGLFAAALMLIIRFNYISKKII